MPVALRRPRIGERLLLMRRQHLAGLQSFDLLCRVVLSALVQDETGDMAFVVGLEGDRRRERLGEELRPRCREDVDSRLSRRLRDQLISLARDREEKLGPSW